MVGIPNFAEDIMARSHSVVIGSDRHLVSGATATGRPNPSDEIEVTLKLRRKKSLPDLNRRPSTPMTRKQIAAKYGASSADITKVVKTLGRFGLKRVTSDPATRIVRLRGTIASMEKAFEVKLFNYTHESEIYRGRVGPVHVPSELKKIVEAVFGLDNRRMVHRRRPPTVLTGHAKSGSSSWYIPSELASHYGFPAGDGSGQTIGLLEFGGGYFPDDLKQFCTMAKLSAPPQVTVISTDGIPTSSKDGAEGEVMLDIEVAAGVCPKAQIAVYFAHFTEQGWVTVLDAAVHDQKNDPGVLSVSWGFAEDKDIWTKQAMTQINETLKEAAALGVTVCVAAGDDGSSDAISDGHAHVDFPSSSPYALAVGGTTVTNKEPNQADIAWKEGTGLRASNGGSTGGGVSSVFPRPQWQKNIKISSVNPGAIVGRCVPDLSANADWNASPYLLVVDGGAQPNGGTSAATPLVASLLTLINANRPSGKRVGYVTPVLYQAGGKRGVTVGSAGCSDVVSGNNTTDRIGGYSAGPGYDAVSGWGTPNGAKLAQLLP
jgi:kumamolisin